MSIPTTGNNYTYGDCTYGMKTIFPDLPDNLGNAKDWADNARADGLRVIQQPLAGTIVVYGGGGGYSEFGHVAEVIATYTNGTFDVKEMNFSGWNTWDQRNSSMKDVVGFIVPPDAPAQLLSQVASGASQCHTWSWNIFGDDICFDAAVGGLAVILGASVMIVGVVVITIFALRGVSLGSSSTKTPSVQPEEETPQPTPEQLKAEADQRSQVRVQRARTRATTRRTERTRSTTTDERTQLRREIRQAQADRTAANKKGGEGWTEATVRLNMARNRLKTLEGGESA